MASATQIPIQFTKDQLHLLRTHADESGRSIAALVREAVDRYLNPAGAVLQPAALWAVLRDPAHWLEFKRIAAEMEQPLAAAPPAELAQPGPVYRHQRAAGVQPRTAAAPAPNDDEPPF